MIRDLEQRHWQVGRQHRRSLESKLQGENPMPDLISLCLAMTLLKALFLITQTFFRVKTNETTLVHCSLLGDVAFGEADGDQLHRRHPSSFRWPFLRWPPPSRVQPMATVPTIPERPPNLDLDLSRSSLFSELCQKNTAGTPSDKLCYHQRTRLVHRW
jgi:hypothetical protein